MTLSIQTLQDAKQACFNGSVRGLAWQKWKMSREGGISALRGRAGKCCAIGWLCPPSPLQSNSGGAEDAVLGRWLHPEIVRWYEKDASYEEGLQFKAFLRALQSAHDAGDWISVYKPKDMKYRFFNLGQDNGLKWPKGCQ